MRIYSVLLLLSLGLSPLLAHDQETHGNKFGLPNHEDQTKKTSPKSNFGLAIGKPIRYRSNYTAIPGVITAAKGHAEFRNKIAPKEIEERLTSGLEIPIPSTIPALAALGQLKIFTLKLSRVGVAYAACTFAYAADPEDLTTAHYRLDVRSRNKKAGKVLQNKKGSCDIDLASAGEQQGLPAVQKGDTLTIADETITSFLQGTF